MCDRAAVTSRAAPTANGSCAPSTGGRSRTRSSGSSSSTSRSSTSRRTSPGSPRSGRPSCSEPSPTAAAPLPARAAPREGPVAQRALRAVARALARHGRRAVRRRARRAGEDACAARGPRLPPAPRRDVVSGRCGSAVGRPDDHPPWLTVFEGPQSVAGGSCRRITLLRLRRLRLRTCPPPPARGPSLPSRAPSSASRSASVYSFATAAPAPSRCARALRRGIARHPTGPSTREPRHRRPEPPTAGV